mmetsp:Transcript_11599/g.33380  ORF Transcript_11599/g.33380 Transcript_11599/m.33380 type:complete len:222 (-) Transcript_11599:742-1407(-)
MVRTSVSCILSFIRRLDRVTKITAKRFALFQSQSSAGKNCFRAIFTFVRSQIGSAHSYSDEFFVMRSNQFSFCRVRLVVFGCSYPIIPGFCLGFCRKEQGRISAQQRVNKVQVDSGFGRCVQQSIEPNLVRSISSASNTPFLIENRVDDFLSVLLAGHRVGGFVAERRPFGEAHVKQESKFLWEVFHSASKDFLKTCHIEVVGKNEAFDGQQVCMEKKESQ